MLKEKEKKEDKNKHKDKQQNQQICDVYYILLNIVYLCAKIFCFVCFCLCSPGAARTHVINIDGIIRILVEEKDREGGRG